MHSPNVLLCRCVQILLGSALAVPLVFDPLTFYPFIFTKAIVFQVLVEGALALWLMSLLIGARTHKSWKHPLFLAFAGFFAVSLVSAFFGTDFGRSFWSTHERMTGVFFLAHAIAYFFLLNEFFRGWRDWRLLCIVSLCVSVVVSVVGIIEFTRSDIDWHRILSILGNPVFVGMYAYLHILLAGAVFIREEFARFRWFFAGAAVLNVIALILSGSRGAILLLLVTALMFGIGYVFSMNARRTRVAASAVGVAILIVASGVVAWFQTEQGREFAKERLPYAATRVLTETFQGSDRFALWDIGLEGFRERPLFGWGPENYPIAFNAVFSPDPQIKNILTEQWYDRAHNTAIDVLVGSGVVGLGAYAIFWITVFVCALRGIRRAQKGSERRQIIVISGAVFGYFFLTMTAFDTPGTVVVFSFLLGLLTFSISQKNDETLGSDAALSRSRSLAVIPSLAVVAGLCIYANGFAYAASMQGARAHTAAKSDPTASFAYYQNALAVPSPVSDFVRMQLGSSIVSNYRGEMDESAFRAALVYGVEQLEESVKAHPNDIIYQLGLSKLYRVAIPYDRSFIEKNLELTKKIVQHAPGRSVALYARAEALAAAGDNENTRTMLNKALDADWNAQSGQWQRAKLLLTINAPLSEIMDAVQRAGGYPYESGAFWLAIAQRDVSGEFQDDVLAFGERGMQLQRESGEFILVKLLMLRKMGKTGEYEQLLKDIRAQNPVAASRLEEYVRQYEESIKKR